MSKLEKVCRLAGAGGILAALVMLPVLLVGTERAANATDAFYVNYFANAQLGSAGQDDVIRIIDTNVRPAHPPGGGSITPPNPLCAMVYVFDEFQELQECCGCPVSAGGRLDLSVDGLTFYPTEDYEFSGPELGPSLLYRGTIKIVSTDSTLVSVSSGPNNGPCAGLTQVYCDATGQAFDYTPAPYLRSWSTHLINTNSGFVAETRFEKTGEPDADLSVLEDECGGIDRSVTNYNPSVVAPERGNCAAVCAGAGQNPYPAGHYGSLQPYFIENEPGQDQNLCYTGE